MTTRFFAVCFIALALSFTANLKEGLAGTSEEVKERAAEQDSVAREVKQLEEGLVEKRAELAKLRHKWVVNKGRVPTEKELKEYEKKKAKGEAKSEDNPYVNKNPLSSSARRREAYYKKLEEIKKDEERLARLKKELH